jgi:hypothetical protein
MGKPKWQANPGWQAKHFFAPRNQFVGQVV